MKNLLTILMSVFVVVTLLFVGCDKNSTEPETDKQPPDISVTYPTTNSVIGDTITFKINAIDNNSVAKVAFFIDNTLKVEDNAKPYEYFFEPSNMDIGSIHTFFAKAYDDAGNSTISDTVNFYYQWILLLQDENEPFPRDLDKVYIRSTSNTLEFRVETNGNWVDPHADEDGEGIDCGIFLDTDQDPNTGLTPQDSLWYTVGDIGPDFVGVVGNEGDSLWVWNSADSKWDKFEDFDYLNLQNNVNYFEVGINLVEIGNPEIVDIVTANITMEPDTTYWDWAPNEDHITYEIDGLYLGKSINSFIISKNAFSKPYMNNSRKLWLRKKK